MKVIVINDSDGHTTALHWSKENLRKVLEAYVEAGMEIETEGGPPAEFLATDPTAETIDTYLWDRVPDVNNRNGKCHLLEIVDWNFKCNPFG